MSSSLKTSWLVKASRFFLNSSKMPSNHVLMKYAFCSPELLRIALPMSSFIEVHQFRLAPLFLTSPCACHSRGPSFFRSSRTLITTRPNSSILNANGRLLLDSSTGIFPVPSRGRHNLFTAVAGAEPDRLNEGEIAEEDPASSEQQPKVVQLKKRIVFGLLIGLSAGVVVFAGGLVYTVGLAAAVFVGAREYFELISSRGIAAGMTPPPRYVSRFCTFICTLMPILALYLGQIDVWVTSAAFIVAMALFLQKGNPRFAQLSSTMFGLFYCGYLPSFWVKLRCTLAVPSLNTRAAVRWPFLLGGLPQWTVGLVATLVSISSIIAADTYAFIGGKAFGRTLLTNISPKKTWEGVFAGLVGCLATTVILSKILGWPASVPSAIAFGLVNFIGSLFGDLIESMIKRDAGVKDSGSLIPGHGGILDRLDSYVFTGALSYSFIKTFLPLFGV